MMAIAVWLGKGGGVDGYEGEWVDGWMPVLSEVEGGGWGTGLGISVQSPSYSVTLTPSYPQNRNPQHLPLARYHFTDRVGGHALLSEAGDRAISGGGGHEQHKPDPHIKGVVHGGGGHVASGGKPAKDWRAGPALGI